MTKLLQGSNSNGIALIEEWPQSRESASTRATPRTKSKEVHFSEYSTRRVYVSDPSYESRKSYSSSDQIIFRKQAAHDAFRIKHLISSCPAQPGYAIQQLIECGLLTREELLGIEHLVSINAEQAYRKRRDYIKSVLCAQKLLRETNENKVNAEQLASVAIAKSSRMIEKARLRAALAL
ncbi:hypothetical protein HJC23_003750 [Cyclotella cryptica]|uniref:Uncharacterized protein n=1 Tax=Cyclotella cryptica TaxID=29204 RepID=A0ABD3QX60_9STRA